MTAPPEPQRDLGFWREVWQQLQLAWRLVRDPEVPFYLKLLPFTALVYVISPVDLVSDFIPILGQLDDITAVLVGLKVFIEMSPPAVVARHLDDLNRAAGIVIDHEKQPADDFDEQVIINGRS